MSYCFVVPHFNHVDQFSLFLPRLVDMNLPIYVVDDGSCGSDLARLRQLVGQFSNVKLVELGVNRGKGAAVILGFNMAAAEGFTHALQIDADGQHSLDDVERLVGASKSSPDAIISGRPVFGSDAPKIRVYGRRVTDIWTALETLSFQLKDSLCGFRIYPLSSVARIIDRHHVGPRMEFDTDILVKAVWCQIPVKFIDTEVIYVEGGRSHFHYVRDNLRLIRLHIKLIAGMLINAPVLVWSRLARPQRGAGND